MAVHLAALPADRTPTEKMSNLTVSVAMTTYNSERFVAEQLESFARQERLPDELVVCDDASTDCTVEMVRGFAAHAPFPVRVLVNETRVGINKNFERAITETAGDIIFISDADDYWYPQKIRVMAKALAETPSAGLAISSSELVDEQLRSLGTTNWESIDHFFPSRRLLRNIARGKIFLRGMPRGGSCMAFRAKFKPLVLPLPSPGPNGCYSYDHFIADSIICSGAGGAVLIPEPLMAYRRHATQVTKETRASISKQVFWGVAARHNKPPHLDTFLEKIESDVAARYCVNPAMRGSAIRHCRARLNMPRSFFGRLPVVVRELLTLRYHHFSRGAGSAFKDLFFSRRTNGGTARVGETIEDPVPNR